MTEPRVRSKNLVVHFDGGCRQKHGIAAGAAAVFDMNGRELATRAQVLQGCSTPVAEYTGLILGLAMARELGADKVKALGDAELIVRQFDGRYKCLKPHLQALLGYVRLQAQAFEVCEVIEFPKAGPKNKRRHGNERADQLCNEAMDDALVSSTSTARGGE